MLFTTLSRAPACASVFVLEATFSWARQLYLFCHWPHLSSSKDNSLRSISVQQMHTQHKVEFLGEAKSKRAILKEVHQETHIWWYLGVRGFFRVKFRLPYKLVFYQLYDS